MDKPSKPVFVVKAKRNTKKRSRKAKQALFKPIPQAMNVVIRGRTYDSLTASSSPVFNRSGITQFFGRGGSYIDSLFGLYRYASVKAVKLTAKVVNTGSEPIILAIAQVPYDWTSGSPTLSELLDQPFARKTIVGSSTGKDTAQLTVSTTVAKALGNEFQASKYIMNAATASSGVSDNDQPVYITALSAFNALSAISCRIEYEVEWHVTFFSLDSV